MSYRELLAIRPFRNLWLGQAISQLGDALYYLIFLYMVEKLTGDAAMVGIAGVAQTLPFLLFSLYAGVVADRIDRRKIMLFADIGSTLILGAFGVLLWFDATPPPWLLIAVGALLSLVNVFFAPAKSAAIPNLVPAVALSTANGLSAATQSLMPLIGMALSGSVLGVLYAISPQYFFLSSVLLNALSFAVSAFFIARLPALIPATEEPNEKSAIPEGRKEGGIARAWREAREGLTYLRRQQVLWVSFILITLVMFCISPFMIVYVAVNTAWFGGAYWTLALCESCFFLGMIVSSVIVGRREVKRPGIAFIWGMAILGLTVFAMAFSRPVGLFAFWNFAAGLGLPLAQIPMNTYTQTVVADAFRGRVNSVMTIASMGVQPLAIGLGGLLLKYIGPSAMLIVMGLGVTFAALAGYLDRAFRTVTVVELESLE